MLQICGHPDCTTLVLGSLCVVHEPAVEGRSFPRGRPFPLSRQAALTDRPRLEKRPAPLLLAGSAVSLRGGAQN